ncbi:MAG TPA: uroporphyrinogen-III synthase [Taishania sp.]|nr:uroporphyrinogen-III synthase [Taishania sp.]
MNQLAEHFSHVKRVFISKDFSEVGVLVNFCQANDIQLLAYPFISFEGVDFEVNSKFDVVFFASKRAVHYFLSKYQLSHEIQIAAAGEATKDALIELGYEVAYYPKNSGEVTVNAQEFASWVGDKKVLFPISNLSNLSYSAFLPSSNFETILIYKTQILTDKIENQDLYAFTSPSNIDGFLASNAVPKDAIIVAWGESTYKKIRSVIPNHAIHILRESSVESLVNLLKK